MAKELKLWNGRIYNHEHGYIAAYSVADAVRVAEAEYPDALITRSEINMYWSGAWGNQMIGITPERGIWVEKKRDTSSNALTAERVIVRIQNGKEYPLDRGPEWEEFQRQQQSEREQYKAQQQAAHQERCARMVELVNVLNLKCGHDPTSDFISFEYHGHKFEVREIG